MSRLPPHHVARPRLTDRCRGEDSLVVVEAAAGYGKSVLGAELVELWGAVPIEVWLEEGPVSAPLLVGRLRAAVARAGFVDAAGEMAASGEDPAGAVDALLAALDGESCAIVIDDAHHAARDAAVVIDRIAARIAAPGRLVVLARCLPAGAERLRRAEAVCFRADDLALRSDETLTLCRDGFGLDVTANEGRQLDQATGGWTAAAVLAASRAKRSSRPLLELARVGAAEPSSSVGSMLDELLVAIGPDRAKLAQLAPLPLLDGELLADVTGDPEFFDRVSALGLPLTPSGDGWWELPGPVRDHLASLGQPDTAALLRAASYYERRGRLGTALQLLLAAGDDEGAAQLLADTDMRAIETLDALELLALYERIPQRVTERYPRATFQVARGCGVAGFIGPRARLLKQLEDRLSDGGDPALRRAVDAERAIDSLNVGRPIDGEALGRQVLDGAASGEQLTRARALTAIGFGLCLHRDAEGRISEPSLREAARAFEQAWDIYRGLGYQEAASGVAAPWALWTELGAGRALAALDVLDRAIAGCAGRPIRIGRLLFHRGQVLGELGRFDDAEADYAEVERIGMQLGDALLVAFSHWGRMVLASATGDGDAVMAHAHETEAGRGEWWSAVGAEFLAEVAESLDRVGYPARAQEYLARAQADPQGAERFIAMAECALLARHGDPVEAEVQLSRVFGHGIFPKEYWRVTLLRACAAWRRGDSAAGTLAAKAFEEAARLGQPQVPLIRERVLSESLLALAVETGSPAAAALEAGSLPMALAVLGRFQLTRGGRPVELGSGQGAQLLKLVAVSRGRLPAERAIESLWPDVEPAAGRNRLRTVLGRLREAAGEVVSREGDLLLLSSEMQLDLTQFRDEARQALAIGLADPAAAVAVARSAVARYRGDLLPDDLYEEWADTPREDARRTMLDLLDLCAEAAAQRGDLDEARRLVQRTIELAPYDDDRYLQVAAILDQQGRRGAALSVIRRARSTLATLGLELPPKLLELQKSLVGSGVPESL